MAESTKIALLGNTHNSTYEALRLEEEYPEAQKSLGEMYYQNGWRSGEDQMKLAEST